jgi:hypothetical protein
VGVAAARYRFVGDLGIGVARMVAGVVDMMGYCGDTGAAFTVEDVRCDFGEDGTLTSRDVGGGVEPYRLLDDRLRQLDPSR